MDPQQPNANQQYQPAPENGQPNPIQPNPTQFTPSEPPKGKKTGLIAGIVIALLVVVGVVVFAMMGSGDKKDNTNSNKSSNSATTDGNKPDSGKYSNYDVTDKVTGIKFSVAFYKDAAVEEKNGRTFLTAGTEGSQSTIYLGSAVQGKIDCAGSPSMTATVAGESTTICYKSDKTQYVVHAKTKDGQFRLNVAGQKGVSEEDAKTILESVSFN